MAKTIWTEKYRPQRISECILPERIKKFFVSQLEKGEIQTMLLSGTAGVGKTASAKALCNELGIDVMFINASENGQIDTIRTQVRQFASTVSFGRKGIKCVIFDECDGLSSFAQASLKGFIEEFTSNCRFIFTTNFTNKIIDPIISRCVVIDFTLHKEEKKECVTQFNKRVQYILNEEGIEFDKRDVAEVIIKYFPDYRKIINEIQRNSHSGKLEIHTLMSIGDDAIRQVVSLIKEKKFTEIRKWTVANQDIEFHQIIRMLYDRLSQELTTQSIPELILILNNYDYKSAFVVDKEINTMAMFAEIMSSADFK